MNYNNPQYGHVQQADAEATRRAQEYQKQLAREQLEQQRKQQEIADAQLAAEMRRRSEQTGQR